MVQHTSIKAYHSTPRTTQRQRVFEAFLSFGVEGATDEQVSRIVRIPASRVAGRRGELCERGRIRDSGRVTENPSGQEAILWMVNHDSDYDCRRITKVRRERNELLALVTDIVDNDALANHAALDNRARQAILNIPMK